MFRFCLLLYFFCLFGSASSSPAQVPPTRIAILNFGETSTGQTAANALTRSLTTADVHILDRDQARAAATGIGYAGSLNLTRQDARLLGAALGSDYYILGDAQTLRRSPSTGPVYFESYASMFVISSRSGNLIKWYRPSHQASLPAEAEKLLLAELSDSVMRTTILEAIKTDSAYESLERNKISGSPEAIIEEAPSDDAVAAAEGLQLPRPFQRIRPAYPNSAAIADAEATVDVIVDIDSKGEVKHAEVDRWAGFGLDEASLQTVEHMHFFPALRNRVPIPMRVLLRYNFRKPAN